MSFETRTSRQYRLKCQAVGWDAPRGCYGSGPWAISSGEAVDLATEQGWFFHEGRWICPAHAEVLGLCNHPELERTLEHMKDGERWTHRLVETCPYCKATFEGDWGPCTCECCSCRGEKCRC